MVLRSLLGLLLGVSLLGCKSESTCSGKSKMCDFFTSWQRIEGTCPVPSCVDEKCTGVLFDGWKLPSVAASPDGAPPDVSCRFLAATTEGRTLDVQLTVVSVSSYSTCCCTGQPSQGGCQAAMLTFTGATWSVSIDGVELGTNSVHFVPSWD